VKNFRLIIFVLAIAAVSCGEDPLTSSEGSSKLESFFLTGKYIYAPDAEYTQQLYLPSYIYKTLTFNGTNKVEEYHKAVSYGVTTSQNIFTFQYDFRDDGTFRRKLWNVKSDWSEELIWEISPSHNVLKLQWLKNDPSFGDRYEVYIKEDSNASPDELSDQPVDGSEVDPTPITYMFDKRLNSVFKSEQFPLEGQGSNSYYTITLDFSGYNNTIESGTGRYGKIFYMVYIDDVYDLYLNLAPTVWVPRYRDYYFFANDSGRFKILHYTNIDHTEQDVTDFLDWHFDLDGNLYIQLPEADGGFVKLYKVGG
jgi:hypothetical protein